MRGVRKPVVEGKIVCSMCERNLSVDRFYKDKRASTGRRASCIDCDLANYDKHRDARKAWRLANADKLKSNNASRYVANKAKIDADAKARATTVKGRAAILRRSSLQRAIKCDKSHGITTKDIVEMFADKSCSLSGIPFDMLPRNDVYRNPFAPSLDRIDNSKGYEIGNVALVCNIVNCGKGEASLVDFLAVCCAVAERHASDPKVIQRLKELRNAEF